MLKTGVFILQNSTYKVTEIDERGFYRIDFMLPNTTFQIDFDSVVYSLVRNSKNSHQKGDASIYREYLKVQELVNSSIKTIDKHNEWIDGVYVTTVVSSNDKLGILSESHSKNGKVVDTTFKTPSASLSMYVDDPIYGVKLQPLDFDVYEEVSFSKDTVNESPNSVYWSAADLKRRFNLSHLNQYHLEVVDDVDRARETLKHFLQDPCEVRGVDTETTGLDICLYGKDHMVGIVLAPNGETGYYYPFHHQTDINLPESFIPEIMHAIIKMQDISIAHNKKFDRQVFLDMGYDVQIKWDTLQISIVDNPTTEPVHGLKYLMQQLNGNYYLELSDIFIDPRNINFGILPKEIIQLYACTDPIDCIQLFENFRKTLKPYQWYLAELECALADQKADQEFYGIRVDIKKYERKYRNVNYVQDMLLKAFRTLTHTDGNIDSNDFLTDLIYQKMHCDVLMRTKTGRPSTSANAIKKLAHIKSSKPSDFNTDLTDLYGKVVIKASELANAKYPALVILSKYREYNKLKTAFFARFERTMKTGRVFFWINQNGAATGRQSSPMHQLPPEIKELILSDTPEHLFWGPDFSQIELRMIAYLAGETDLIELAKDPNNDIHRIIGSLISKKEMWAITKEERSTGKRRNFGVVYLITEKGLADQIFGPGHTKENLEFCKQQLDAFYKQFKRIDRYIKNNAILVQKRGYMETKWFHRRRIFKDIFDPKIEPRRKASILRMANNIPVQGTAADYLKVAEVKMYNYIREHGWNKCVDGFPLVRNMLSIHDEIIISAHESIPYEEIIKMITLSMESPVDNAPPFFVQPALMDNWEGHSDDAVAMPIPYRDKVIADYDKTHTSVFKSSWFKLIVPDSVRQQLAEDPNRITNEIVSEFWDKVTLVKDHGDYDCTITDDDVKIALKNFYESGFTLYHKDNYLLLLNEYRDSRLRNYMDDLIAKYGTDPDVVGSHVRHPSLTHELLSRFEHDIPKDLEHVQKINEATKLYIAERGNSITEAVQYKPDAVQAVTDKDLFMQQLDPMVNYDGDGNVVYAEDAVEDVDTLTSEETEEVLLTVSGIPTYVWELGDCVVYDTADSSYEDINRFLSYAWEHSNKDGFYRIELIKDGNLIDTHLKIENPNVEEMNNLVNTMIQKHELVG